MGAEFFSSPFRVSLNLETASAPELLNAPAPRSALHARSASFAHARALEPSIQNSASTFCRRKSHISRRAAACRSPSNPGTSYNRSSSTGAWAWKDPSDSRRRNLVLGASYPGCAISSCAIRLRRHQSHHRNHSTSSKRYYHSSIFVDR